MEIKISAPAKINLTLEVLGKRPDGYHDISTVMQSVNLYDTVSLSTNDSKKVTVSCNYEGVPCDDSNLCVKAAYKYFDYCRIDVRGVHINIEKLIPTQAGLGGGSADAAAVIMGLNRMLNTRLTPSELAEIAERVGADVPFCLEGGTKLATGTGTQLKKLPNFRCDTIVICKPDTVSVSTAEAYKSVDSLNSHMSYTDEMIKALHSRDIFMITTTLYNDFEAALQIPEVNEIKSFMLSSKALGCGMSGSGSAVFAIFNSRKKAEKCAEGLKEKYNKVFMCKPVRNGCTVKN